MAAKSSIPLYLRLSPELTARIEEYAALTKQSKNTIGEAAFTEYLDNRAKKGKDTTN